MPRNSNIAQFEAAIKRHAQRPEARMVELLHAVAMRGLSGLVLGTRVDTGRARGNWQVTLGAPAQGHEQETYDKTGGQTIAHGARQISGATIREMIWIHNGVPYIIFLEDKDKMLAGNVAALRTWIASLP